MPTRILLAAFMLAAATTAQAQTPAPSPRPPQASQPPQAPQPPQPPQPPRMVGNWSLNETRSPTGMLQVCSATIHYDANRSLGIGIFADKTIFVATDPAGNFVPGLKYAANIHFDAGPVTTVPAENATATDLLILASPQLVDAFTNAGTMIIDNGDHVYFDNVTGGREALDATRTCAQAIPKPAPAPAK